MPAKREAIERFKEKVIVAESGCHEWTAGLNPKGYGQFKPNPCESWQAHRWIYHYFNPETPISLYILHKCDNRKCVNPEHLYAGTQQDNMDDMYERGRNVHVRGEAVGTTYLTEKQVSNIKGLHAIGLQPKLLAKIFNSKATTICSIVTGKVWGHVSPPVIIGNRTREAGKPGRGWRQRKVINMLTTDGKFIRRFTGITQAAEFINRCPTGFREVINGKQPTWGGYKWEYTTTSPRKNEAI